MLPSLFKEKIYIREKKEKEKEEKRSKEEDKKEEKDTPHKIPWNKKVRLFNNHK